MDGDDDVQIIRKSWARYFLQKLDLCRDRHTVSTEYAASCILPWREGVVWLMPFAGGNDSIPLCCCVADIPSATKDIFE